MAFVVREVAVGFEAVGAFAAFAGSEVPRDLRADLPDLLGHRGRPVVGVPEGREGPQRRFGST